MRYIYNNLTGVKKIKTKARALAMSGAAGIAVLTMIIGMPLAAKAATTQIVVTPPVNSQGWSTNDTTGAGAVTFNNDTTAPGDPHNGALQLTTGLSPSDKAQYYHGASDPLAGLTDASYYTKQNAPAGIVADPAYHLVTFLNGGTSGFTTLVFEPYQNTGNNGNAALIPGTWQKWDVAQGLFWSTRTVTCSSGTIVGTPGGPASYTLAQINTICPSALVAAFGVDIGSNNLGYNVEADLVNFNGATYNFEPYTLVSDKDQCKDGGWMTAKDANGNGFKNQGACVSYVASNGKSQH